MGFENWPSKQNYWGSEKQTPVYYNLRSFPKPWNQRRWVGQFFPVTFYMAWFNRVKLPDNIYYDLSTWKNGFLEWVEKTYKPWNVLLKS